MARLKVKDSPFLVRDELSNGIINTDTTSYEEHTRKKRLRQKLEDEKVNSEHRLNRIESEVSELKLGINQILEMLKR